MRFRERVRHLVAVTKNFIRGQTSPPETRRESLALQQLHHEIIGAYVVKRADMRMAQRGDGPGFAFESLAESRSGDLEGNVAAEPCIVRAKHCAHAALADFSYQAIRSQLGAGLELRVGFFEKNGGVLPSRAVENAAAVRLSA